MDVPLLLFSDFYTPYLHRTCESFRLSASCEVRSSRGSCPLHQRATPVPDDTLIRLQVCPSAAREDLEGIWLEDHAPYIIDHRWVTSIPGGRRRRDASNAREAVLGSRTQCILLSGQKVQGYISHPLTPGFIGVEEGSCQHLLLGCPRQARCGVKHHSDRHVTLGYTSPGSPECCRPHPRLASGNGECSSPDDPRAASTLVLFTFTLILSLLLYSPAFSFLDTPSFKYRQDGGLG